MLIQLYCGIIIVHGDQCPWFWGDTHNPTNDQQKQYYVHFFKHL